MIHKSRFVTYDYVSHLDLIIWHYLNCKTWNRFCIFSITVQCCSVTLLYKNDTKITVILALLLVISARFLQYFNILISVCDYCINNWLIPFIYLWLKYYSHKHKTIILNLALLIFHENKMDNNCIIVWQLYLFLAAKSD